MIDIPGYRILRVLGQGGMATVYLALQESVQREVALKIMAPTLVGDEFGERFLREARIAARLHHPHVVQVHDVGRCGELHYIAMEYLGGGQVLRRGEPRGIDFALRVTREIAEALGYAHARGVVHRDIKPDNLLLREDGGAVLTDFGIARASDAARMTMAGMIMGTPHYMAPEQATGRTVDGRADLYSLGVVLYELLLDRVPYNADDWVAVGMMHISAPLPQLPAGFAELQPLLDRLLAKDPERRIGSGAELAAEITRIERLRSGPAAPAPASNLRPRLSPEPTAVAPIAAPGPTSVDEPGLGRLDQVLATPSPRQRQASQSRERRPRRWPWLVVALAVLVAVLAYALRGPLSTLLPPTEFETVLLDADRALLAGRLTDPAGFGARELYRRAAALDPDDERARLGLRQVGEALLERARLALDEERLGDARDALSAARELGIASALIEPLEQQIVSRQYREMELGDSLREAQAALAAGRLDDGDDSALVLYRQALRAAPDNALARQGLRETLSQLLLRARERLDAGELDEAERQIEAVAAIDPAHLELVAARASLAEARQQQHSDLTSRLDAAAELLRRGRLIGPAEPNARAAYRTLLAERPDEPRAADGLRRVAAALVAQADRALADFEFERARRLLDDARATAADAEGLRRTEERLESLQRGRAADLVAAPSDDQQRTIDAHLAAAQDALGRGELLSPPGDSAYDRYKAVLSLQPANPAALAGIAGLPAAARQRFERAIGTGKLSLAHGYIDGVETLAPDDSALPDMKRRLASSWIGHATERLGAGELQRAAEALERAGVLDPSNPELPALRARLEQAGR